ncbi:MAG: CoA activase [Candidatus Schekmanbacteria bacterium]|nr:MAG: CoA activase [Candidatus Schekmanbacteria bacterium]
MIRKDGEGCYFAGIDIGSISVNVALLNEKKEIIKTWYRRFHSHPISTAKEILKEAISLSPNSKIALSATGSGGKLISKALDVFFLNEVVAQAKATAHFYPEAKTIIEMGGQDSKLILIENTINGNGFKITDFATNTICAAGTGSFLDQQANRLGISIEDEFSELALKSEKPPRIAGRCSVFAKSDMIHLQQIGTPDYDIVAGLCYAVARNFKSNIARGKEFIKPVVFQGGVASNRGMVKAFRDILELNEEEFIVHKYNSVSGAIGSALILFEEKDENIRYISEEELEKLNEKLTALESKHLPPLSLDKSVYLHNPNYRYPIEEKAKNGNGKIKVYLGIDVGSISTNVVAIDENGEVVARRYLMTAGRPIEAVRRGLEEIGNEVGDYVEVAAVGTTGSGRYLTGDLVGADIVRNEITAQAKGAAAIDPEVDTIFEIGGQDSKYISLTNGVVSDFEMNKVCAAGTGSFLEEQAEKLNVNIKEDFSKVALSSKAPVKLGERCTVFIESDIVNQQQKGTAGEDIVSGLSYSIVYNYLNRVVGNRKIGNKIFFQGGVAYNKGVIAAFEKVLNKKITVPPHHDVTGAIGVALLAKENAPEKSAFKGFDLSKRQYTVKTFECKDCSNLCEIRMIKMEGEKPLFYGSRCEKYDVDRKKKDTNLKNYFNLREEYLLNSGIHSMPKKKRKRVGIPRILYFYELFPMWKAFFEELGCEVVLSSPTNKSIIERGVENVAAETCFPIKVAHGHILDLLGKDIDYLFLPSVISLFRENQSFRENHTCPYVQASPYIINASLNLDKKNIDLLQPVFHLQGTDNQISKPFKEIGKKLGVSLNDYLQAYRVAMDVQKRFYSNLANLGKKFLDSLKEDEKALVIVSRPYNGFDSSINLGLPEKLCSLGVRTIPMDFLPLNSTDISPYHPNMYWKSGQRILSAAQYIRNHPNLFAVYITNFGCGPDSFISHFFADIMKGKPYLQIEIDEHSADAGVITRCEAFLDSLENYKQKTPASVRARQMILKHLKNRKHTIFIPNMTDHAYAIKSAFNYNNVDAEVIEESDDETVQLGRQFTSGKECYPCILTTGDLFKTIKKSGLPPERIAFFMPSAEGPCRFGQYHQFQRLLLDENGYENVPIYSLEPEKSYSDEVFGKDFDLLAWEGIIAIDILEKAARETRPYEINKGETDEVYQHCLRYITNILKCNGDIARALEICRKEFEAIKVEKKNGQKPKIGIVGEIYIRSNRFANQNIVKKVEELGGEAWVAPLSEWFLYSNYVYKKRKLFRKQYKNLLKTHTKDRIQKLLEHKLYKTFEGFLENGDEPATETLIEQSKKYLDPSFDGEAILSVGKAIDFAKRGLKGIINAIPFSCLPGTVVTAISKKLSEDFGNIPWLNISFDGMDDTGTENRLEAFIYQAKDFKG